MNMHEANSRRLKVLVPDHICLNFSIDIVGVWYNSTYEKKLRWTQLKTTLGSSVL